MKSYHQSKRISTVPAQSDLSCKGMGSSLNPPSHSYQERGLRPGAVYYCQNKAIILCLPVAVTHEGRTELISPMPHTEQRRNLDLEHSLLLLC